MSAILTLNAGSSSIKFALYAAGDPPAERLRGQVEALGEAARLELGTGGTTEAREIGAADHADALRAILDAVDPHLGGGTIAGVGHRVVHGGAEFDAPVALTDETVAALTDLMRRYNRLSA